MADNVHVLRPRAPHLAKPDPYAELQYRRTAMINAWTAWLAVGPDAADVLQEIHGTTTAMRSLADLMQAQHGRGGER